MIPINVDLSDVVRQLNVSASQSADLVDFVTKELTARLAQNWANQAKRYLHQSRQEYLRSLIIVDKGRFEGAVILTGQVPNMIEQGANPFDMKRGFANSDKKKYNKKGGWYLTIPFRYATPGALAESSIFSGKLPEPIYEAIKSNPVGLLKKIDLPEGFDKPKIRSAIQSSPKSRAFQEYQHKSSIFEGLKRDTKQYDRALQSQFTSFRRVGSESDDNAFIHKGINARMLAEKAIENTNIGDTVANIIDEFFIVER